MNPLLQIIIFVLAMPVLFAVAELLSDVARRKWPTHFIPSDVDVAIKNLNERVEKLEQKRLTPPTNSKNV